MRAALLLFVLCACTRVDLEVDTFACELDVDCGDGWVCDDNVCRNPFGARKPGPVCNPPCAPEGKACCGDACVDLATDPLHCGACDVVCRNGEGCIAGTCGSEVGLCDNGADDDHDGDVDCADSDCPDGTACGAGQCCAGACRDESSPSDCSDGVDNDCDGKVDCADEGCTHQRCAHGRLCSQGVCVAGCHLDGRVVSEGEGHPLAACLRCVPEKSLVEWTSVATGEQVQGCSDGRACDGRGGCRRALGEPCAGSGDCASLVCTGAQCAE